jgi:hypothetical protein
MRAVGKASFFRLTFEFLDFLKMGEIEMADRSTWDTPMGYRKSP